MTALLNTGITFTQVVAGFGVLLSVIVILAVLGGLQSFRAHTERYGTIPVLWRWFSGHHHHKREPYSRLSPDRYRPHCKRRLPGRLRRVIWRTFAIVALPWYALAWFVDTPGLWFVTAAGSLILLVEVVRHNWLTMRTRAHYREYVKPLAESLRAVLHPEMMPRSASEWVNVDQDYRRNAVDHEEQGSHPHWAIVDLPRYWNGGERVKERTIAIIRETCGMDSSASVSWSLDSRNSRVEVHDRQPPPRHVGLSDITAIVDQMSDKDGALIRSVVLGLGRASIPVTVSLDQDSPNIGLSMGPGAGKSQLARLVAAQILHRGGVVIILDVKRISHAWARDLPNVRYAKTVEEIHETLLDLDAEVDRRTDIADIHSDIEGNLGEHIKWPRMLVIVEESNEMMTRLRRYWAETRDKRKDQVQSPAIQAYEGCLFMGRQILINMLAVAQMMTARASGSGAARENMGVRILGRFSRNNWRMLVPEFDQPDRSMHPGRVQVVTSEVRECQVAFMTGREAREYALSGIVTPFPKIVRDRSAMAVEASGEVIEAELLPYPDPGHPEDDQLALEAPATAYTWVTQTNPAQLLTLRECLANMPGKTIDYLRNASKKDPAFPEAKDKSGREYKYDGDEIMEWHVNKQRRGRKANAPK